MAMTAQPSVHPGALGSDSEPVLEPGDRLSREEFERRYQRTPKVRKGELSIGKCAYVSPRLGTTGAKSDHWVHARPGTEALLAMGVLNAVVHQGWVAQGAGIDLGAVKEFVSAYDPHTVSEDAGVPVETIVKLARWLGQADGALALLTPTVLGRLREAAAIARIIARALVDPPISRPTADAAGGRGHAAVFRPPRSRS